MANLTGFNAAEHEAMRERSEVIPPGKYLAAIVDSEMKPTKNGRGEGLNIRFEVLEGPHKGASLYTWLNLRNQNEQAVQIAQCELAAICKAVNVLRPSDSMELHNLPLALSVRTEIRDDNGKEANRIAGYYPKSWLREQSMASPQPAAVTNGGGAPWKRQ